MDESIKNALAARLLAMADDELILAHRNSEWTGHAPLLEEDIAIANIAQDELGHATTWYQLLNKIRGDDPDQLAFFRDASAFRNVQMVELPKGDWAFTLIRQYLFDAAEISWLTELAKSAYAPLAERANMIRREELYHLQHSSAWVKRLGLGTDESHARTQKALDQLWAYALQLFVPLEGDGELAAASICPDLPSLAPQYIQTVAQDLAKCNLKAPDAKMPASASRSAHTHHLETLLSEMQEVARFDPEAVW